MCENCDYEQMIKDAGLDYTSNRMQVLSCIGNSPGPMSAGDIYHSLAKDKPINRVTVYRVLDLLVRHRLLERISAGGRSFFYGMAPNAHHRPHPHFYCRTCGRLQCLNPEALSVDFHPLSPSFPGRVENVAVQVAGVCGKCLSTEYKDNGNDSFYN